MKIIQEIGIMEFDAWNEAIKTKEMIINMDKAEEFDSLIEELYPEGIEDVKLNDILWFDRDWVLESLGIMEEEEDL